ncbi:unnamed protein product [Timema podura]|uniref:Uncharacterized protein n=2 Tax=Timema TaxID=61471 RepID=A0A7R9PJC1_TIMGE|nr:unnamed protein product [Timema genevievae]CAG2056020.1 unnamed protein product [Timema podura]
MLFHSPSTQIRGLDTKLWFSGDKEVGVRIPDECTEEFSKPLLTPSLANVGTLPFKPNLSHPFLVQDSEETNNELSAMLAATPSAPGEERKYRHQRLLQKQVQEVHSSAKKLTSSQARLQHQVQ